MPDPLIYQFGELELDTRTIELRRPGRGPVPITPKVFDLIALLIRNRERSVPKRELYDALWPNETVSPGVLTQCVWQARRALGDDGEHQRFIKTSRGRGYRFIGLVREVSPEPSSEPEPEMHRARLIGREREVQSLRGTVGRALRSQGGVAFLAGAAGVGKTRLLDEISREAETLGAHVLGANGLREELLERAREHPLLVVLDDLHELDEASLQLLERLAASIPGHAIAILCGYRNAPCDRTPTLTRALAALRRVPGAQQVDLDALPAHHVGELAAAVAGRPMPEDLQRYVYAGSGGNAYFVVEFAAQYGQESASDPEVARRIPTSVRDEVRRRLCALHERANRVLEACAVADADASLALLNRLPECDEGGLLESLDEAVRVGILVETTPTRYRITPPWVRDVIYTELSHKVRTRLHREIGEALEIMHVADTGPVLDRLAHHFYAALQQTSQKAVDYAREAGDQAAAAARFDAAVEAYDRALAALRLCRSPDPACECEILLAKGAALWGTSAAPHEVQSVFARAAALALGLGSAEQYARAALGYASRGYAGAGRFWWERFPPGAIDPEERRLLENALDALPPGDSSLRAQVIGRLALARMRGDPPDWRTIDEALFASVEMAGRIGDPRCIATAMSYLAAGQARPGIPLGERIRVARAIVHTSQQNGSKDHEATGHLLAVGPLVESGSLDSAELSLREFARACEELGRGESQSRALVFEAMRALLEGRFEPAERTALAALERARPREDPHQQTFAAEAYLVQMMALRVFQGRACELLPYLEAASVRFSLAPSWRCVLAYVCLHSGREVDAAEQLALFAKNRFEEIVPNHTWIAALCCLGEVAAAVGDLESAGDLYTRLSPHAERMMVVDDFALCMGAVHRPLGVLARVLGRNDEAARHFERALALHRKLGARPLVAWTELDYATLALSTDSPVNRAHAISLLESAGATSEALGMRTLHRQIAHTRAALAEARSSRARRARTHA